MRVCADAAHGPCKTSCTRAASVDAKGNIALKLPLQTLELRGVFAKVGAKDGLQTMRGRHVLSKLAAETVRLGTGVTFQAVLCCAVVALSVVCTETIAPMGVIRAVTAASLDRCSISRLALDTIRLPIGVVARLPIGVVVRTTLVRAVAAPSRYAVVATVGALRAVDAPSGAREATRTATGADTRAAAEQLATATGLFRLRAIDACMRPKSPGLPNTPRVLVDALWSAFRDSDSTVGLCGEDPTEPLHKFGDERTQRLDADDKPLNCCHVCDKDEEPVFGPSTLQHGPTPGTLDTFGVKNGLSSNERLVARNPAGTTGDISDGGQHKP